MRKCTTTPQHVVRIAYPTDCVGSAPGLIHGGCHGATKRPVFDELCEIVEEAIELYHKGGKPLPPPTSGRDFANKMQSVA